MTEPINRQNTGFDVILGFDMETDIGSYTPFYEGVQHGTPHILGILGRHKIEATFYWTGHAAEHNPEVVRQLEAAGHETGCHGLFHETLGDPIFPLPNNWPILPEEIGGRLRRATALVEAAAGRRPVSFRCPRLWGSTEVVKVLENLGYVSDASFPLYFYGEPALPYYPSAEDWTRPGYMRILEIPNFCDLDTPSSDPYQRDRDQWPLFRTRSAEALMEKAEKFLRRTGTDGRRPVLCLYLHPWEFHPMPQGAIDFGECSVSPLPFITENCGPYAVEQLDVLCSLLKAAGGRFLTARRLAEEYRAAEAGHQSRGTETRSDKTGNQPGKNLSQ